MRRIFEILAWIFLYGLPFGILASSTVVASSTIKVVWVMMLWPLRAGYILIANGAFGKGLVSIGEEFQLGWASSSNKEIFIATLAVISILTIARIVNR